MLPAKRRNARQRQNLELLPNARRRKIPAKLRLPLSILRAVHDPERRRIVPDRKMRRSYRRLLLEPGLFCPQILHRGQSRNARRMPPASPRRHSRFRPLDYLRQRDGLLRAHAVKNNKQTHIKSALLAESAFFRCVSPTIPSGYCRRSWQSATGQPCAARRSSPRCPSSSRPGSPVPRPVPCALAGCCRCPRL